MQRKGGVNMNTIEKARRLFESLSKDGALHPILTHMDWYELSASQKAMFSEAIRASERNKVECDHCAGSGEAQTYDGEEIECPACGGDGEITSFDPEGTETCPECDGSGEIE